MPSYKYKLETISESVDLSGMAYDAFIYLECGEVLKCHRMILEEKSGYLKIMGGKLRESEHLNILIFNFQ